MEMKKKAMAGVVVALGITAALSLASHKMPRPMLDDRYFGKVERQLFYPAYNEKQPNKLIIETTKEVLDWMAKNKFEKGKIANPLDAAKEVNAKIHKEKNAPFDKMLRAYIEELAKIPRDTVTPKDFVERTAMCGEKTVFETAVLRELGIDAQILAIYTKNRYREEMFHLIVAAKIKDRKLILDPFYGIVEDNPAKYKRAYINAAELSEPEEFKVFPLLKYEPKYEKYLKNYETEKKLDADFKNLKRKVREAP